MQRTLDALSGDERTLDLAVALALADRPAHDRLVLVVDQLEESFTLCRDEEERAAFLGNLTYAATIPGGRTIVVVTLRRTSTTGVRPIRRCATCSRFSTC